MKLKTAADYLADSRFTVPILRRLLEKGALQRLPASIRNWKNTLIAEAVRLQITVEEADEWYDTDQVIDRFRPVGTAPENGGNDGEEGNKDEVMEDVLSEKEENANAGNEVSTVGGTSDDTGNKTASASLPPFPDPRLSNTNTRRPGDKNFAHQRLPLDNSHDDILAEHPANDNVPSAPISHLLSTSFANSAQNQMSAARLFAPPPPPPPPRPPHPLLPILPHPRLNLRPASHAPVPNPFDPNSLPSAINGSRNPWYPYKDREDAEASDPIRFDPFGVFHRNEGSP